MKHRVVYADSRYYAGWPANHGAWATAHGELIVGFMRGGFSTKSRMHHITQPFEKMFAVSDDQGESWRVEKTPNNFSDEIVNSDAPQFELGASHIRVCGVYDHGGDYCNERGGFYLSTGRFWDWKGPYLFTGLEEQFPGDGQILNTSRTCALGDFVFLSRGFSAMWGTDETFCAFHDGEKFNFLSTVCSDDARAVMPSAARVGERMVVVMRRRKSGKREGWIDSFCSDDQGQSWRRQGQVGVTGRRNGNPPALTPLFDGRLCCVYGNRDQGCMMYAVSEDRGRTWQNNLLRESEVDDVDIGYPRLIAKENGTLLAVYYFVSKEHPQQHIAVTEFSP